MKSSIQKFTQNLATSTKSTFTSHALENLTKNFQRKGKINRIMLTGANGQLGRGLLPFLMKIYGADNVLATDVSTPATPISNHYQVLNILDKSATESAIKKFKPDTMLNLAALLSAAGERNPQLCYDVNVTGFKNVLDLCTENKIRMFSPSTIAAFGPSTPKVQTPNATVMRPTTMYGSTKVFNELLGTYYHNKFQLDFRSLRYPQVISDDLPHGGSGDYSVEIFFEGLKHGKYQCYVNQFTRMPMIYIEDLIRGTMQFIEEDVEKLNEQVYNIQGCSFTVQQLIESIQKYLPHLEVTYKIDFRQKIVDTWPEDIDDAMARKDWNWEPHYTLPELTKVMLELVSKKISKGGLVVGEQPSSTTFHAQQTIQPL